MSGSNFAVSGAGHTLNVHDVYIHNIISQDSQTIGLIAVTGDGVTSFTSTFTNVTIATIHSAVSQAAGFVNALGYASQAQEPANFTSLVENITINDIVSTAANASGYIATGLVQGGTSNLNATLRNITIAGIRGAISQFAGIVPGALTVAGGGIGADDRFVSNLSVSNLVLADNASDSTPINCLVDDMSVPLGGSGSAIATITSQGGNLSDDNSCSTYFTQPTDQNNVAALAASLLPLADNGGYVPTMALKEGSPAIDSGITIAGLTTDARGITRPQGTAYDSGAYESPYSKPATPTLAKSGESIIIATVTALSLTGSGFLLRRKRAYVAR